MSLWITSAGAAPVTFVEVQTEGAGGLVYGLALVSGLALSPDGGYLYGAGTNDNAVAVFQRNAATGRLRYVESRQQGEQLTGDTGPVSGLDKPVRVAVSPEGTRVYAISVADGALAVFDRDATTGRLSFQQALTPAALAQAHALALSPDGTSIYVAGDDANGVGTVVAFTADATTVAEAQGQVLQEGANGITGLAGAAGMALSSDGKYLYVSGAADNAIAVFARDASSGALMFKGAVSNGSNGVTGLQSPEQLVMSGDGRYLYVAAAAANAVVAFQRDSGSGGLTFVQSLANGQQDDFGTPVTGLGGVYSLAVSPEGSQVYAASEQDNALTVFHRNPVSGRLTVADVLTNGQNGVDGLDEVLDLAVSPDGQSLYSAASIENAIGVFSVAAADLNLVMTADAIAVNTGQHLQYSLVVTNNGPDDATHVTMTDPLPSSLTYVSATPSQGACSQQNGEMICPLGTVAAGALANVTLAVTVNGNTAVSNTAQVVADQRDPVPGDGLSSSSVAFNTPPTAVDDNAVTNPAAALTVNVLANDSDPDGDTLSVSAFDVQSVHGGAIKSNGDGALTYTPPANYTGKDSFHYTVSDGRGGTATATVNVLVNTPPDAAADHVGTTANAPVTIYVLANDHDPDGDSFSITAVTPSKNGATVTNNHDGTVTYDPPAGFTGSDIFTYTITDARGASASTTVTVDVRATISNSSAGGTGGVSPSGGSPQGGHPAGGGGSVSWVSLVMIGTRWWMTRQRRDAR